MILYVIYYINVLYYSIFCIYIKIVVVGQKYNDIMIYTLLLYNKSQRSSSSLDLPLSQVRLSSLLFVFNNKLFYIVCKIIILIFYTSTICL